MLKTLTTELLAVVSELPTRKTHNALRLPPPSRLSVPVKPIVDEEEYTPGPSVNPPNNGSGVPGAKPLRAVIAVLNSP